MDLEQWLAERTFHHSQFSDIAHLVKLKRAQGLTISLCFPSLNEEKTIGREIRVLKRALMDRHPLLDEILVVDSGSSDRTRKIAARHGAEVHLADDELPEMGRLRGKGENLWKSLYLATGNILVWIDSDIRNIHPKFVYGLVGPLLTYPEIGYVKAFYRRPIRIGHRLRPGGGRVTELLVRPFLSLLYPDLSLLAQPLSGEYAGRRSLLERVPFLSGYPVEVGLLIDIEQRFGIQSIAQVDLDVRVHRNQPIDSLRNMSCAILSVLMMRSEQLGKLALLEGLGHEINLVRKDGHAYIRATEEIPGKQRPPMISVASYRLQRGIPEDDLAVIESSGRRRPAARMLNIAHLFQERLVNLELKARTRDAALAELADLVRLTSPASDPERIVEQLKRREGQMSTVIGHGVAIPHALTAEVAEPTILFGRSKRGVGFASSLFHRPVRLLFVIIAPEAERTRYLEILSSLARLLSHRKVGEGLLRVRSAAEAISVLRKYEALVRLQAELGVGGRI
jgi:glucosyl-3-phosphoglycerate synthase